MKADLLTEGNATEVKKYMLTKFEDWSAGWYPKSARISKTLGYYYMATKDNKDVIRATYISKFKEPWPTVEQTKFDMAMDKKSKTDQKFEYGEAEERAGKFLGEMKRVNAMLKEWDKGGQEVCDDNRFFLRLRGLVEPLASGNFDSFTFNQENYIRGVKSLTTKGKASLEDGVEANLDFMLGVTAKSVTEFKFDDGVTKAAAKLETQMRAGLWGKGSVTAKIGTDGLSAEAAIAAALGLEFKVDAEAIWTRGDMGLRLAGDGRLFLGAEGNAKLGMSITREGLEAKIKAGAFAGIKAKCGGEVSLQYMGGDMVKVRAEAEFSIGVGAEFEASIKCSLFDGTEFKFKAALTHGVGTGLSVETTFDFDRMGLAANAKFRDLIAYRTIMKGYSGEIMDQEKLNQHYLTKSIKVLDMKIKDMQDKMNSMAKLAKKDPMKVGLLAKDSDFLG